MNISEIQSLISVVDSGSFTIAAKQLHISQSTVSFHIRQLEEKLDMKLLDRSRRGKITLTPGGKIVYRHGKIVLNEISSIKSNLEKIQKGSVGDLMVAASYTSYTYILPKAFRLFLQTHPEIRLSTQTGFGPQVYEAVKTKQAELGIVWAPVSSMFSAHHLCDEPFWVVAHSRHPLSRKSHITPGELNKYPIVVNSRGSSTRKCTEQHFQKLGVTIRYPLEYSTPAATKESVLAGLGIGVLAASVVRNEIAEGKLCRLPVEGFALRRQLLLIHLLEHELSSQAKLFKDFLLKWMQPRHKEANRFAWK